MTTEDTPMGMPTAPHNGSAQRRVGVLAATPTDTEFGAETCRQHGYLPICAHISETPQAQTLLQRDEPKDHALTKTTIARVQELVDQQAEAVVIYCNSLSSAVDLGMVRAAIQPMPLITPLDAYDKILPDYTCFGLLAANGQSFGNLERYITEQKNGSIVVGVASLSLVNYIEDQMGKNQPVNGEDILRHRHLLATARVIQSHDAEVLILACTHFTVFHQALQAALAAQTDLPPLELYEPTEEMMRLLAQRLGA